MKKRSAKQRKKPKPNGLLAPAKPPKRYQFGPIVPAWFRWANQCADMNPDDPTSARNPDPISTSKPAEPTATKSQIPPGFEVLEGPRHV